MSFVKQAPHRTRWPHLLLLTGLIVTLLWPVVTAFVVSPYDVGESCAGVNGSADRLRYDFLPPRLLCATGGDGWVAATDGGVTIGLSLVLVLAVAAMIVGIVVGVRSVPTVAPAASAENFAYVTGSLPSLWVRRLRRLCGLLAVASVVSPAWMLYLGLGVGYGGSAAPDPYTQIPGYLAQLVAAAAIPLLALGAGVGGWVLRARARSGGGRYRGADAASVAVVGLVAAAVLLGLTLALGLGAIAKVVAAGERSEPPAAGNVELLQTPALPPDVVPPTEPSTALSAVELEQQFGAFVAQTTARFGPAFEAPAVQGEVPGPALDLAVAAAPYAFDCADGAGIGYGLNLSFSGADTDDWDVNYAAAAAAFLRITDGWAVDGYPSQTDNSEFLAYADSPSVVSQLRARHIGSIVRVGLQSLCVAK